MRTGREDKALAQLLRAASLRAEELGVQLGQLQAAKRAAETSIDWLDKAVAAEERSGGADPEALRQFQRYLAGADIKRRALAGTRDRLAGEIEATSAALAEAAIEVKKFEHLLGMRAKEAAKDAAKDEAALADERAVQARGRR